MVETARMLNPKIEIVIRTNTEEESELLGRDGLGTAFLGEHELAFSMTRHILKRIKTKME
jgi:CPA2 family monovalent cation:H+ antiporter-2